MSRIIILIYISLSLQILYTQTPTYYAGYPRRIDSLRSDVGDLCNPVIADLNRDGQKEIIVGASENDCMLYVIKSDGTNQPGFPKLLTNFYNIFAVGDVDGDGYLDIALRAGNEIDVLNRFGNHLPGFPIPFDYGAPPNFAIFIQLYDLDNNGKLEIIADKFNGLAVFNYNGQIRNGWPVSYPGESNYNVAIGDLDNDGFGEIVVSSAKYPNVPPYIDSAALRIYRNNGMIYSNNWPIYFDSVYATFFGGPSIYINHNNPSENFIILAQSRRITSFNYQGRLTKYNVNGNIISRKYFPTHDDVGAVSMGNVNENNQITYVCGSQYDVSIFDSSLTNQQGSPIEGLESAPRWTPCIGRLTSSNQLNVLVTGNIGGNYGMWGLNYDASALSWSPIGRPKKSTGFCLGDINNDGQVEMIAVFDSNFSSNYHSLHLHVWTIPGVQYNNHDFPWPMYGHDRYRSFQYGFIPPDEVIGIKPISNEIPTKYNLEQNYPNPFNPGTKIKFNISKFGNEERQNVKIKVFDILGREVVTLVNESLTPGVYEITFNPNNISSGIYFYSLITQNFAQTKKMVILK